MNRNKSLRKWKSVYNSKIISYEDDSTLYVEVASLHSCSKGIFWSEMKIRLMWTLK